MSKNRAVIIGIIGLGIMYGCSGCAPSAADRKMIVSELKAYEATQKKRTASDIEKAKITVFLDTAEARYGVQYPMSQFGFTPTQMNLKKIGNKWVLVSETNLNPCWPHRKEKTTPIPPAAPTSKPTIQ